MICGKACNIYTKTMHDVLKTIHFELKKSIYNKTMHYIYLISL